MVVRSKRILIIIGLLFFSSIVVAGKQNPFEIIINETTIEYGKSLSIKFNVRKAFSKNLSDILVPFKDTLNYDVLYISENKEVVQYKIKIYPTYVGDLIIPSLKFREFESQPFHIKVREPSSINKQPIKASVNTLKISHWVREQINILATVISTDKNIVLERKNIFTQGIESYLVPQSTTQIVHDGSIRYKHTIGWNIFFLYAQKNTLRLPEVEYIKDGVPRYKFHFPQKLFNVKSLPVYISPDIPVGIISVSAKYLELPNLLMQPGATAIIQYSLTGMGVPAKWLPSLSQKYTSNLQRNIQYSPLKTILGQTVEKGDLVGIKTVDIAFTPLSNGFSPFKSLNLQYFDPNPGLLKTLKYQHPKLLVLNWFIQLIMIIVILFISTWVFLISSKIVNRYLRNFWNKYRCIKALSKATTSAEIVCALNLFSHSERWSVNLSLYQWLTRFESKYIVTDEMLAAIRMLNHDLYAGDQRTKVMNSDIKQKFINTLNNLQKKRQDVRLLQNFTYLIRSFINRIFVI